MFNSNYKKETLQELERANDTYKSTFDEAVKYIEQLQKTREASIPVLTRVENHVNAMANVPQEYVRKLQEIRLNRINFEKALENLKLESKKTDKVSGGIIGAGAMAGAGVAALGPSAAMAVAMTFGTASTGTAIATLSGAAATNAALAWLGGGALAAGGAGMAGGSAFLALAGPLGWAIGGAALVGGGAYANHKNKEIAKRAEKSTQTIKKETTRIKIVEVKVQGLCAETKKLYEKLDFLFYRVNNFGQDYRRFGEDEKNDFRIMMNIAVSLSKKIVENVQ